jgi:hypothetical protein
MVYRSFVRVLALTTVVSGWTRLDVGSITSWQVDNKASPGAQQTSPTANPSASEIESNPWAKARPYFEKPFPDLRANVPELKGLAPATSQDPLTYILDRAGEKCVDLLSRIPNVISREEVTTLVPKPPRMGVSIEPYIGIQREKFDYLLLSKHTESGTKLEEYRMVNGRPATTATALGQLSQGFTSEWLRIYPGNRSESRFRYLGQQMMDQHHVFVLGFAQIPESVRFPARFSIARKRSRHFPAGSNVDRFQRLPNSSHEGGPVGPQA